MTLEQAVSKILELKNFPVALWTPDNFGQYAEAFEVFWMTMPNREQYNLLMASAPVTSDVLWIMLHGRA